MKRLIIATAVVALAACAEPATEEATPVAEETTAPAANEGPGTFEVTYADGSVGTVTTTEEGTFTAILGDETGSGTVTEQDGKLCFDPEGDDPEQPTRCWTNSEVGEDGSWTSTSDDGETVTVRPAPSA
ncbi:MAG: hypothetical protein APF78_11560 [Sphingomonadales bacterium BRH_c3]|nr:MAG: hypothetical protein APF78_11560 [Sphingomonadales bacterium BRH_c3]